MDRTLRGIYVIFASAALTTACAPQQGPDSVSSRQAGQAVPMRFGTIESVRAVDIRPGQTRLGTIAGALAGGAAGSTIGNRTASNVVGATAGAVAGGAAGSALQGSSRTAGVELSVMLDSGETIAVVQPGEARDFRIGDRVRVAGTDENVRVSR